MLFQACSQDTKSFIVQTLCRPGLSQIVQFLREKIRNTGLWSVSGIFGKMAVGREMTRQRNERRKSVTGDE